jgi:phage-related protein
VPASYGNDLASGVLFNGKTARSLGLLVASAAGWLDLPAREWPTAVIPGRAGAMKKTTVPLEAPREIRIPALINGTSIDDARAKRDAIAYLFAAGPVKVVFPDNTTRYLLADVATITTQQVGPQFRQSRLPVEIVLTAFDPYLYDGTNTVVAVAAAAQAACPLGTALVRPVLSIAGAAAAPTVTLYKYDGTVMGSIAFATVVLAGGDTLVIDCQAMTAKKNGASVVAQLSAGDFIELDPVRLADRDNALWPYLVSASGGLTVTFARAWL